MATVALDPALPFGCACLQRSWVLFCPLLYGPLKRQFLPLPLLRVSDEGLARPGTECVRQLSPGVRYINRLCQLLI